MKLRDYQNNLISATRNAFRTGSKAPCVVLPCGGGNAVCPPMAEAVVKANLPEYAAGHKIITMKELERAMVA